MKRRDFVNTTLATTGLISAGGICRRILPENPGNQLGLPGYLRLDPWPINVYMMRMLRERYA